MHLYIITRGIKGKVDELINDLQAQYFKYKIPKGKQAGDYQVQLAVRPIQLYELVFPEEALGEVQKTLWNKTDSEYYPEEDNWKIKGLLQGLRRMLGAKKMPKIPKDAKARALRNFDVGIQPVGIKKDKYEEDTGREIL